MFHITDYFPTIIGLLGGTTTGLDGVDQWESLTSGTCKSKLKISRINKGEINNTLPRDNIAP